MSEYESRRLKCWSEIQDQTPEFKRLPFRASAPHRLHSRATAVSRCDCFVVGAIGAVDVGDVDVGDVAVGDVDDVYDDDVFDAVVDVVDVDDVVGVDDVVDVVDVDVHDCCCSCCCCCCGCCCGGCC